MKVSLCLYLSKKSHELTKYKSRRIIKRSKPPRYLTASVDLVIKLEAQGNKIQTQCTTSDNFNQVSRDDPAQCTNAVILISVELLSCIRGGAFSDRPHVVCSLLLSQSDPIIYFTLNQRYTGLPYNLVLELSRATFPLN